MVTKLHCENLEIKVLELYNERDSIYYELSKLSDKEIENKEHERLHTNLYMIENQINEYETIINSYYATVIGVMEKELNNG